MAGVDGTGIISMAKRAFTLVIQCDHCGRPFLINNSTQKHCSITCRFWSKVSVSDIDDCWIWNGSLNNKGYGTFNVDGASELSNRVVWLLAFGEWPTLFALHHCDNPKCVNPNHLFLGTHIDNARDRESKGRGGGYLFRGKLHFHAALSEVDIPIIRKLISEGVRNRLIGLQFGVTCGAIASIANHRSWNHVV